MKRLLPFFFLAAFLQSSAQDLTDSLSKYSYLIQAKENGASSQATGCFVRYKGRLFFLTAAHCLTGWDPFQFKQIENAPDTVYIRLSNDTSKLKFLPLPVAAIKKATKPFREYESPDVYVVEIKEAKKYPVYSVEQFFDDVRCDKAKTITVLGYPHNDAVNDYLRDRQQPLSSTAALQEALCLYTFRPEVRKHDELNYYASIKDASRPGLSGAPAYILTEDKRILFGGIYIGGDDGLRTGMVVRPEYVIAKVMSKIQNK